MNQRFSHFFLYFILVSRALFCEETPSKGIPPDYVEKSEIKDGLCSFYHLFKSHYALKSWKKKIFGWTPQSQLNKQMQRLDDRTSTLSLDDVKSFYSGFYLPLGDHHLSISYEDQRQFYFPLQLIATEDKILVRSDYSASIKAGDQLVAINGLSPLLYGKKMLWIPSNEYQVSGGKSKRFQQWRELARHRELSFLSRKLRRVHGSSSPCPQSKDLQLTFQRSNASGEHLVFTEQLEWIEKEQTFQPKCSTREKQKKPDPFFLRIIEHQGKRVGLFRIDTFSFPLDEAQPTLFNLYDTICKARSESDAIVVDLRNNGGGYGETAAFIASCLIDRQHVFMYDMDRPSYRQRFLQTKRNELNTLHIQQLVEKIYSLTGDDPQLPTLKAFLAHQKHLQSRSRAFIDQYESQEKRKLICTELSVSPSIENAPLPPIYVLQNAFSGSASEIFSAFMQSSGSAKVAGTLSAGATGWVREYAFHPHRGVGKCRITGGFTLIEENGRKRIIEDIGVVPDLDIGFEASDLPRMKEDKDPILSKLIQKIIASFNTEN